MKVVCEKDLCRRDGGWLEISGGVSTESSEPCNAMGDDGGGDVRCSGGFSWGLVGNYGEEERGEVKRDLKASTDKS